MKLLLLFIGLFIGFICNGQRAGTINNDHVPNLSTLLSNDGQRTLAPSPIFSNTTPIYWIQRSTLGLAGSSKTIVTQKGSYNVSQSIGQRSVAGTFYKKGYGLRQGYQQPLISIITINSPLANSLKAVFYPNPFQQSLNISFETPITKEVQIILFDVIGRPIYIRNFPAWQLINIDLSGIATGVYIIKVTADNKYISANLIKN